MLANESKIGASKMKRIRPLLAMAFALALICLGGSFAFADDEGGNRSMRGGRLPWQIRLPWTIGR